MTDDPLLTGLCLLVLFLGAMQGRVATLLSRSSSGGVPFIQLGEDHSVGAYTAIPIIVGWLAALVWGFKWWPWYWACGAVLACALASGPVVNLRTLGGWMRLRPVCAIVIIVAAAVLWI
jgi:hypothetical protein